MQLIVKYFFLADVFWGGGGWRRGGHHRVVLHLSKYSIFPLLISPVRFKYDKHKLEKSMYPIWQH